MEYVILQADKKNDQKHHKNPNAKRTSGDI